ncbi:MAG: FtsX-like permease family protein, partial [Ktedonobacteraceae bacterium]
AVLRALGMAPQQVATILIWEQGMVYLVALLLGLGLGCALTVFVAPAFSLLDNLGAASVSFNPISEIVPIHTVIPQLPIWLMLACLTLICLGALLLMARIATRPSMSQTLRLNED